MTSFTRGFSKLLNHSVILISHALTTKLAPESKHIDLEQLH